MEESPFSKNENDGARLLEEIVALIRRFIVVSEAGAIVAAVWVLHTYSFQASDHTPYLFLRSAKGTCNLQVLDPQWTRVRVVKDCRTSDSQMMEAISLLRRGVRRERQRPLHPRIPRFTWDQSWTSPIRWFRWEEPFGVLRITRLRWESGVSTESQNPVDGTRRLLAYRHLLADRREGRA